MTPYVAHPWMGAEVGTAYDAIRDKAKHGWHNVFLAQPNIVGLGIVLYPDNQWFGTQIVRSVPEGMTWFNWVTSQKNYIYAALFLRTSQEPFVESFG